MSDSETTTISIKEVLEQLNKQDEMTPDQLRELGKQLQAKRLELEAEARRSKGPTKRGRGVLETTKKILLDEPDIPADELYKRITEKCGTCSYAVMQTVRSDFAHTLRVLEEAGRLQKAPAEVVNLDNERKKDKMDGEDKADSKKASGD